MSDHTWHMAETQQCCVFTATKDGMWKPATLERAINPADASSFHHRAPLSTPTPVEAMLEIRTTDALGYAGFLLIRCRTGSQTMISKLETSSSQPDMRFGDKCPLFQSIYYCF